MEDIRAMLDRDYGFRRANLAGDPPILAYGIASTQTSLNSAAFDTLINEVPTTDLVTGITAHAGGGQSSAVALTAIRNNVTVCATAGDSVKLLSAAAGLIQSVTNNGAANLNVFPFSGDAINALAVNLSVMVPPLCTATFFAIDGTTWYATLGRGLYISAPTTQTGGLLLKAAANSANYLVTVINASFGQASVLTIPDPGGATANFVMSEAAATINGVKTFGSIPIFPTTGVTLGSTTTTEAQIAALQVTLGAATASKAVTLDANSLFDGTKLNGWDNVLAAAGSAFAPSSATEAAMNLGSFAIAANRLQAKSIIEFEAVVLIGAVNATDTFTLDVRLGANDAAGQIVGLKVLGATTAANDYAIVRGRISVRSIVTTTCTMTSVYDAAGLLAGTLASETTGFVGAFTKDSTGILYLNVCGKWSTGSGTNSATLQVFNARVLGN